MNNAYNEPEGIVIFILVMFILIFSLGVGMKYSNHLDELDKPRKMRQEQYIKDNCELAGWYGKSGTYPFYRCNGILMKDTDIERTVR